MMTVASGPGDALVAVADLQPELRPAPSSLKCFECGGVVTPVLPTKTGRRRHFRHMVAAGCSGSGKGEGPLHLDAKLRLEKILREMASRNEPVRLEEPCPGGCNLVFVYGYIPLRDGDVVERERYRDHRRPDVAVFRDDEMIAAFEIAVTHYCDAAKWADMSRITARTVEVEAFDIMGAPQRPAWEPPAPIPAFWVAPVPSAAQPCERCAERDKRKRDEDERRERGLREAAERRERERAERTIPDESWRAVATLLVEAVNAQRFVISRCHHRGQIFGRIVDSHGLVWATATGMVASDIAWLIRDMRDNVIGRIRASSNREPSRVLEIVDPPESVSERQAFDSAE